MPDAVLKTNRVPTGIAVSAPEEEALLMPHLLRDPGCGFLSFRLNWQETPPADWDAQCAALLEDKIIQHKQHDYVKAFFDRRNLNDILLNGIQALNLPVDVLEKFNHTKFTVLKQSLTIADEEKQILLDDFLTLTNTIEFKKIKGAEDVFGFMHCGSLKFPSVLADRFQKKIYEYSLFQTDQSNEAIDLGLYGVPYYSVLGQQYFDWIHAAMNYALVNRYTLFALMKDILEQHFPCTLQLESDLIHAGVFVENGKMISTRGSQQLKTGQCALIAGQRETNAVWVQAKKDCVLPHGTSYQQKDQAFYDTHFSEDEKQIFIKRAKQCVYNSTPDFEQCIAHTFNLEKSMRWFYNNDSLEAVSILEPLINLQSAWLQGSVDHKN